MLLFAPTRCVFSHSSGGLKQRLWQSHALSKSSGAGSPNLQDPMPDDLRWSWCNNNRNKVHNKSDALESSPTPTPLLPSPWKSCLPQNQTLMSKSVGTSALEKSLSAVEENVFLSYLLLTDLRIKFTWDRLTKESKRQFNNVHMGETQDNWVTHQNGWSPPLNTIFS